MRADGPTQTSSLLNPRGIDVSFLGPSHLRRTGDGCWLSGLFVILTVKFQGAGGTTWRGPAGGERMGEGAEAAIHVKLQRIKEDEYTLCLR